MLILTRHLTHKSSPFVEEKMLADALLAISLAISSALAAEVMAWLVIYRKETYKKVTAELEHQQYEQRKCIHNAHFFCVMIIYIVV